MNFTLFNGEKAAAVESWVELLDAAKISHGMATMTNPSLQQCTTLVLMEEATFYDVTTMFASRLNEMQLKLFELAFQYHVESKREEFLAHQAAELKEAALCKALSVADPQDQQGIEAVRELTVELARVQSQKRGRTDE